jgi:protein-S-isoprenylcysteine O-methyltransferase Ste14
MLMALLGWCVYLAAPLAFLGPVFFMFYIGRFQIAPEERVLTGLFGDEYATYCKGVRRWL